MLYSGTFNVWSLGETAIFCSPIFPHSNQHLTHFLIRLLTKVMYQTTNQPFLLIAFMVSSLLQQATF